VGYTRRRPFEHIDAYKVYWAKGTSQTNYSFAALSIADAQLDNPLRLEPTDQSVNRPV
jgi:hypothetical protein